MLSTRIGIVVDDVESDYSVLKLVFFKLLSYILPVQRNVYFKQIWFA